jgi:hypothetical protein
MAEKLSPEKLLDLYKIAVDEYRFEVRLGWDRTTYFLILNSAILSVATGLLKLDDPAVVYLFIAFLFGFGVATSIAGVRSIAKNHEYYRRTIVKKTAIEEHLGLNGSLPGMHPSFNLAIGTTSGQNDRVNILSEPENWVSRPHRKGAISSFFRWVLVGMAVVHAIGVIAAIFLFIQRIYPLVSSAPDHLGRPIL